MVSERDFQTAVIEYAELHGWRVFHFHDARRQVRRQDGSTGWIGDKQAAGWVDLTVVRSPDVLLLELKSDRGRPTAAQKDLGQELADCPGVEYYLLRPRDWPMIEERLGRPRSGAVADFWRRLRAVAERLR